MNNEHDAVAILKARLAAGEITVDKYQELRAIVQDELEPKSQANMDTHALGQLLAQIDNIFLYENYIVIDEKSHPVSYIVSVDGMSTSYSMNLVPIDKKSFVNFTFLSGEKISLSEERTLFGNSRHKAIQQFHSTLQRLTFRSRLNYFAARLVQEKRIMIFKPLNKPFFGKDEPVFLTSSGQLETQSKQIDLKKAKAIGSFGIGAEEILGRSYNTVQVVASETKWVGRLIPLNSLRFTPNTEDKNVVYALLKWLTEQENSLN